MLNLKDFLYKAGECRHVPAERCHAPRSYSPRQAQSNKAYKKIMSP